MENVALISLDEWHRLKKIEEIVNELQEEARTTIEKNNEFTEKIVRAVIKSALKLNGGYMQLLDMQFKEDCIGVEFKGNKLGAGPEKSNTYIYLKD